MNRLPILLATLLLTLVAGCAKKEASRTEAESDARDVIVHDVIAREEGSVEVVLMQPPPPPPAPAPMSPPASYRQASGLAGMAPAQPGWQPEPVDRENYAEIDDNPIRRVDEHPVSTFSVDVDTGSYTNVRRMLNQGRLPPADAVRAEEFINYFDYGYPVPTDTRTPFSVSTEIAPAPWNPRRHLLLVGLKGYQVPKDKIPAANLVYLIDTSGSMQTPDKLELLKHGFAMMSRQLRPQDRVAIVAYAGSAGLVLPATPGDQQASIQSALERLRAGGSTNGGAGIQLAYAVARENFIDGGVNRVILASDGDFNVGTTGIEALKTLVGEQRRSGIGLTVLGFGGGNLNDHLAEQIANTGNGNYFYVDTLNEARKVLVEQLSSTVLTIAEDVKIQIEFNPAVVEEYRLIGYENRVLAREDFNNDQVDAGEIGAGHSVTALYELALVGSGGAASDPLRYQPSAATGTPNTNELAFLRLRHKAPGAAESVLNEQPIQRGAIAAQASERLRFAAAVAGFADALRGGSHLGGWRYGQLAELARGARAADPDGYRAELVQLIELAGALAMPDSGGARIAD